MHFEPGLPYHVYNRGIHLQTLFFANKHYWYFLQKIAREWTPYCSIERYCLLPDEFHIICFPNEFGCGPVFQKGNPSCLQFISRAIGHCQSGYARAINDELDRTGPLFKKKTSNKLLLQSDEEGRTFRDYYKTCGNYIEEKPVIAGLVNKAEDWPWSSRANPFHELNFEIDWSDDSSRLTVMKFPLLSQTKTLPE